MSPRRAAPFTPSAAPPHCTPPRPFRVRNPFERTLVDRLNSHVCSPGMFKIRESSGGFKWDIEQVSILKPADIVACSSQFEPTPDPILEKKATEAIEEFFSQEMIVPSPFDEAPKRNPLPLNTSDIDCTPETGKYTAWAQTNLSFPTVLPPEVENVLKPFYSSNSQSSNTEIDTSGNASLRRKLCFEAAFSEEEEDSAIYSDNNFKAVSRGLKRSLEFSPKSDMIYDISKYSSTSPILKSDFKTRCGSIDEMHLLKSPSLSPINHKKDCNKSSTDSSANNSDHGCDVSTFSQSTPEKLKITDTDDSSNSNLLKRRLNDDLCQSSMNVLKLKRCQSDLSLAFSSHKNLSINKMDISNDESFCNTRVVSDIDDSADFESVHHPISSEMEVALSDISNYPIARTERNYNFIGNSNNKNFETNHMRECLTPVKYKKGEFLQSISKNFSSPMQTSHNDSFNLNNEFSCAKSFLNPENTVNFCSENNPNFHLFNSEESSCSGGRFRRIDSGFSEINHTTKSFQNSTSTSVRWRRYDSGFDEVSSDVTNQTNLNDSIKLHKKPWPITEHDEDIVNFDEFSKSDLFNDDMALMNCNFSSTPSKSLNKYN